MYPKFALISMLFLASQAPLFSQSASIGIKIGNNGNLSLSENTGSNKSTQMYSFGNGYQGGVEFFQPFLKVMGIKAELYHLNCNIEADHNSSLDNPSKGTRQRVYEEMAINISSFNFSPSLVINIGRLKLAAGPEISWAAQATGRGARHLYENPNYTGDAQRVQYDFYSKRKQVYNVNDENEVYSYVVNRVMKAWNFNVDLRVFKTFSAELKVLYPLSPFIKDFVSFENNTMNQMSLNTQLSVKYSFLSAKSSSEHKSRKKRKT